MSHASSYSTKPGPRHRALLLIGLPLFLGLGFAESPLAQSSPESAQHGDHRGPHHRRMLGSRALEGPPAPGLMRDSIQVTGKQLQQYTGRYESHMAATRPSRDSLRTSMQAVRAAFESGNRSEARTRHQAVERQWKQLVEQDQKFEAGLKDVLTKDQQARYQQWKEKRKQEARDRWRKGRRAAGRHREGTIGRDSTEARQPFDSTKALTR